MTARNKWLVLVDGSERSTQTVHYLRDFMPVDEKTRMVLFHVFYGLPEEYLELEKNPAFTNAVRQLYNQQMEHEKNMRAYLEKLKEILILGGFPEQSIETKLHWVKNGVARDIIHEAKNGYSAVVLRRRGMRALTSIILGSVAVKLLQVLSFVPIIFVGQTAPVKKVLLAVDASASSMKAVEFLASSLAGKGHEVCIFHAILGLGSMNFAFPEGYMPEVPEVTETCVEAFKSQIAGLFQEIRAKLIAAGFEPGKITEKIVTGVYSRSQAIIQEAEHGGYGTIVVGRRGLSKTEAFFMGRVGHKVVYGGKKFTVWVV